MRRSQLANNPPRLPDVFEKVQLLLVLGAEFAQVLGEEGFQRVALVRLFECERRNSNSKPDKCSRRAN